VGAHLGNTAPPTHRGVHRGGTAIASPAYPKLAGRLKDRLGDHRGGGGSEWEPIKILLLRENSG
jgi:hypothetical protein